MGHFIAHYGLLWLVMGHFGSFCLILANSNFVFSCNFQDIRWTDAHTYINRPSYRSMVVDTIITRLRNASNPDDPNMDRYRIQFVFRSIRCAWRSTKNNKQKS